MPCEDISLTKTQQPMKIRLMALAISITFLIFSNQLFADVNVLIIGSSKDSGEMHPANVWAFDKKAPYVPNSKPFSPTAVGTQLQSILAQDGRGTVNVTVLDRYRSDAITEIGWTAHSYTLAGWFHYPYPAGAETARWANLRGEAGTVWDYVVLIGDPYTMEYTPGMYAHGVAKIAEEVAKGATPAQVILLMPWPATGSSSTINHYKEVVYRTGRSGGHKVAPGGLAWQAIKSNARTDPNPDNDGAYIAAASIYSSIYNQSAAASGYVYNDTHANTTFTTYTNNNSASQYTGTFSFQNPYKILDDKKRGIRMSERGTSTEEGFKGKIKSAMDRAKVTYAEYNDGTYTNNIPPAWATSPLPIDFNYGRDGFYSESAKSYLADPTYWQAGFGYYYQNNTFSLPVETANDIFIGLMQEQDNDLANRMINEAPVARNIPTRTLWAQIHKEYPTLNPLRDGSGPHLNYFFDEAVGTYIYTLFSGRCPLDPKPAFDDITWTCRKIGYETAWRLGRCQSRAPGFKVTPSAASKKSIIPGEKETMTVQFIFPPKQDVTVNVSISNANAAVVGSQQLVFTPQNYNIPQNVTVAGLTGSLANDTFNVVFSTTSTDEVCNGLSDTWDYTITRSAPVTLTRVNKATNLVTAYQNLPVTINLNTSGATSTNTVLAGPSRGTAVWSGSDIIYTPSSDFVGKDGFSFATNDGTTLSVGYVEITVTTAAVNGRVSYRGNGSETGTVPMDSNTYAQNATVTVLGNTGNLTRVGYNFAGWNTAANGSGTNYAAAATFSMGASGAILYAKWTAVPTYTITYNANSSTSGTVPFNQTKTDGINLTLATNIGTLARTNYNFAGWNTLADGTGTDYAAGATYIGNANLTLYAKWTPVTYAVTYNTNSSTSGTAPANQTKTFGVNLTLQTNSGNLARTGYTFAGWNTLATGLGTDYAPGATYTTNAALALFAKWTAVTSYTVSYNANGATSGTVPADQTKQQDVTLTLANNTGGLARTSYTFAGWNTAANGTGTPYATSASYTANTAVVLYAQWAGAATYAISYNGNGNTGGSAPSNQTKSQGVTLALATNSGNLTKTGFSFSGWNTATNGGGTAYAAGANYTVDAAAILYAQWNALPVVDAGADRTVYLTQSTPWSPSELAPQLWLDGSTATNNAGTVSITNAGSGGGTISGPASLAAGGIGTLQAVQFNAASKYLTGDYTNTGTTLSAFFVGKSLNVTQPAYAGMMSVWTNGQASDWNNVGSSVLFNQNNSTANSVQTYRNAALSSTTGTLTAGFLAGTVFDGTTNTAYLNGTAATGVASSGSFNAGKVVLGARWQTSAFNNWWNGNFGEAIICNANLNTTDRQKVEGYLAHKWGLAGNLSAGHPYKNAAPGGPAATATLDGTVTDTDSLTTTWSVVSGPASVSFGNANAIDTTATFTVVGVYTLRLTANDGYGSVANDVVITVSNPTPYSSWTGGTFVNTFTDTALTSNPDGDNLTNLQEFAFGMDPTSSATGSLAYQIGGDVTKAGAPLAQNFAATGQPVDFRAVFARRKDYSTAGLTYTVQFSADLSLWTASATSPTIQTGVGSAGNMEAVSVPFPTSVSLQAGGTAAPKFFRVGVSSP
jgi:uncharacterized repeat protein (TIGR02543 family)